MEEKSRIRKETLAKRKRLGSKLTLTNNRNITESLQNLSVWSTRQSVHVYLPIEGKNEIDTWPIVEWLLENGQEVWASHLPEDESQDGFCQISKDTKYGKDRFGAPLPLGQVAKEVNPTVIIVTCLAADKSGNRLGYGSGWYDKFLANHPKATKIGLIYNQFLLDEIPHEPHDIKLDLTITESQVISTK